MWIDLIVEYLVGFTFGLFIFQSLFMKNMVGDSYLEIMVTGVLPNAGTDQKMSLA